MPSWKRFVAWTCVAALLVGVGFGTYQLTPPAPRCQFEGGDLQVLIGDGSRLATFRLARTELIKRSSQRRDGTIVQDDVTVPLFDVPQIWDTRTGALLTTVPSPGHPCWLAIASNPRFFVGEIHTKEKSELLIVDLVAAKSTVASIPHADDLYTMRLSEGGKYLARLGGPSSRDSGNPQSLSIYETATGRLLSERKTYGLAGYLFTDDMLCHTTASDVGGNVCTYEVIDPARGALVARFEKSSQIKNPSDGQHLFFARSNPTGQAWILWNMRMQKAEMEFELEPNVTIDGLLDKGKYLLLRGDTEDVRWFETREVPANRPIAKITLPTTNQWRFNAPDLAIADSERLRMLKLPTLETIWERSNLTGYGMLVNSGNTLILQKGAPPTDLLLVDRKTGAGGSRIYLPADGDRMATTDGRMLFLVYRHARGRRDFWELLRKRIPWLEPADDRIGDGVIVVDMEAGRERLRVTDWNMQTVLFSPDGQTLVTVHGANTVRVWDIDAWKPLRWAVGVPAGLGVVIVLAAWWRSRRRRA